MSVSNQAQERFDQLWKVGMYQLNSGLVERACMRDGTTDPVDYCVSIIARLMLQENGGDLVASIREKLDGLSDAMTEQFLYEDASLHVSLLGCTPRQPEPGFAKEKIETIAAIARTELVPVRDPAIVTLRGIGIIGNQLFIQGLPHNRQWEHLRRNFTDALEQAGEHPLSYPDTSPIHINVARITNTEPDTMSRVVAALEESRNTDFGIITLTRAELVITDFVVSSKRLRVLDTYNLSA